MRMLYIKNTFLVFFAIILGWFLAPSIYAASDENVASEDMVAITKYRTVEYLVTEPYTATKTVSYVVKEPYICLLYTSPSPRDRSLSRMPSSA